MTIALWSLFGAALLHVLSKIPLAKAQKEAGGYNNATPRDQQNALTGWGKRALAAHQNQIESFPLFAAGILVATATKSEGLAIEILALSFLIARILYIFAYVKNLANLRSIAWTVGFLGSLALICSPAWISFL